ncbi:MAG: N-acetyltransferase family protein [Candidatus Izemoplasmatales bacterium]
MAATIRKAVRADVPQILSCIRGIAEYEKLSHQVEADEATLEASLFDRQEAHVLLCEEAKKVLGFALYFYNFSTFKGRKGLYLEDLFVFPNHRGKGYGRKLFLSLVQIAKEEHCGRMEWVCLDWNSSAIDFYTSLGAKPMSDWTIYRLDEIDLEHL